jgi:hypothetical protein
MIAIGMAMLDFILGGNFFNANTRSALVFSEFLLSWVAHPRGEVISSHEEDMKVDGGRSACSRPRRPRL